MHAQPPQALEVTLPVGGGKLQLKTQDEVDLWEELANKYIRDYSLSKSNDLGLLGAILSQHLSLFRAQQRMNGMEPELDHGRVPTGRYKAIQGQKATEISAAQKAITNASQEIRELEKSLGIDKKTREAGGQHTVGDYVTKLKRAAHQFGVHISKRTHAYEEFVMELRWKIRVLRNGDPEDRQVHNISEASILEWAEGEMVKLENVDKEFAKERGRVYVGQL